MRTLLLGQIDQLARRRREVATQPVQHLRADTWGPRHNPGATAGSTAGSTGAHHAAGIRAQLPDLPPEALLIELILILGPWGSAVLRRTCKQLRGVTNEPGFRVDDHGDRSFRVFFIVAPDQLCYCIGEDVTGSRD